jgi:hypothetical protein
MAGSPHPKGGNRVQQTFIETAGLPERALSPLAERKRNRDAAGQGQGEQGSLGAGDEGRVLERIALDDAGDPSAEADMPSHQDHDWELELVMPARSVCQRPKTLPNGPRQAGHEQQEQLRGQLQLEAPWQGKRSRLRNDEKGEQMWRHAGNTERGAQRLVKPNAERDGSHGE